MAKSTRRIVQTEESDHLVYGRRKEVINREPGLLQNHRRNGPFPNVLPSGHPSVHLTPSRASLPSASHADTSWAAGRKVGRYSASIHPSHHAAYIQSVYGPDFRKRGIPISVSLCAKRRSPSRFRPREDAVGSSVIVFNNGSVLENSWHFKPIVICRLPVNCPEVQFIVDNA